MATPDDDILDVSAISFLGDFDEQVEEILTRVRLTRTEVENLQYLIDDLTQALSCIWPGCVVYPFGSIVTGLGIKTSDIDCFIHIHPSLVQGRVNPVIRAKNTLWRLRHKFTQLFAITTAKVPILKFQHIPTGFHCDINFTSFAGVRNSKLIAYMLNLDPRAVQLAVIVKYWSKVNRFTGTNLMPNYALTMMVIFYLQVMSVLPSVETLQRSVPHNIVENWNTAFDNNIENYSINNNNSLYTLLGGFFNYYATFDFENDIISPFIGTPLRKELFIKFDDVPSEFYLYKDNVYSKICKELRLDTVICVQDPFDHSRNCAVSVYKALFAKINSYFQLALKAYDENEMDKFLRALLSSGPVVSEEPPNKKRGPRIQNKINKRNNKQIITMKRQFKQRMQQWKQGVRDKIRNS